MSLHDTISKRRFWKSLIVGLQLCEEFLLLGGNASLALVVGKLLGVPSLLLDLGRILGLFLGFGIGTDGSVRLLVHTLNLHNIFEINQ